MLRGRGLRPSLNIRKQQVYAEELKTQLAEKMPGVISAMAEAVTGSAEGTDELFKLMEEGAVSATEYLPEFARILEQRAMEGGAYEKAIRASTAEQQRFNNVFNDLVRVFADAGFEEGQAQIFRTMAKFLERTTPLIEGLGEAWVYLDAVIRVPLGLISDAAVGIEKLSEETGWAKGNIVALGTVIGALMFPFTRTITTIGLILTALEDLSAFISGRDSLLGKMLGDDEREIRTKLLNLFQTLINLASTLYDHIESLAKLISGNVEFSWLDTLKERLTEIEEFLQAINVLLGGKSRIEIAYEKETDPKVKEAMRKHLPDDYEDRVKTDSAWGSVGQFLYKRTLPGFIDNMTGGDPLGAASRMLKGLGMGDTETARGGQIDWSDYNPPIPQAAPDQSRVEHNGDVIYQINGAQDPEAVAEEIAKIDKERFSGATLRYGESVA